MVEFLIMMVGVSLSAIAMWVLRNRWVERKRRAVYVCNLCGEHHCECTIE